MTRRVSWSGSALSATDHRLSPGPTTTWARFWLPGLPGDGRRLVAWTVPVAANVSTAISRAAAGAITAATTARPRLVRRSGPTAGLTGRVTAGITLMVTSMLKPSFEPTCVRSYTHSIAILFDRSDDTIVVSRGSDIFRDTSNRCLGSGAITASLYSASKNPATHGHQMEEHRWQPARRASPVPKRPRRRDPR